MTNTQFKSAYDQITEQAFLGSAGYQLEEGSRPGAVRTLPESSQKPYWSLNPFEPPSEVAEGWHRIKYVDVTGKLLHSSDPRTPAPTVYVDFGLQRPAPGLPPSEQQASLRPGASTLDVSKRDPLPEHLHPAAESEESLEREVFSQHIERNEYSNFKLRSETRAIESLYAVIQRMTADQHVLSQATLETPRRVTLECKQLIETMGETMRSFHSMIEVQSLTMQAIQKQIELTRVPAPPPPPPDYVGLGKTLLETLRDLGMKAIDSGYVRRPISTHKVQELPEIRDAEVSVPAQPSAAEGEVLQAEAESKNSQGAEELRRIFARMGEIDIARAFASPESLQQFLIDIRKEIGPGREKAAAEDAHYPGSAQAAVAGSAKAPGPGVAKASPSSKTPPSSKTSPSAPGKAQLPASSQTSRLPVARTSPPASAQTPNQLKHAEPSQDSQTLPGQKQS